MGAVDAQPHVLIVGAGHAGTAAAGFLRKLGWRHPITLLGDEGCLPYQRPPLSKDWLQGRVTEEALLIRGSRYYVDQNISLNLSAPVVRIHRSERRVTLQSGSDLNYSHLVLATGARPVRLQGADRTQGVFYLRNREQADALRRSLVPDSTIVIVGGGYVGLEVAATAIALGVRPIVIEREARPLARVASAPFANFIREQHVNRGVRVETGCTVASIESKSGKLTGVLLSTGEQISCSLMLVGIGARPNDELFAESGGLCHNGIVVDNSAKTSDPFIYAVGDCTIRPLPFSSAAGRLESVPSALEQAKQAATSICGRPALDPQVSWFWSHQFDKTIQIAGRVQDAKRSIIRQSPERDAASVLHFDANGALVSVEAMNAQSDFMAGKQLIAQRMPVDTSQLKDWSWPLSAAAA